MGQDIVFIQHSSAVVTPSSDPDEMLEDGSMIIECMALGSGNAWPCYVRLWFIAAYRYILDTKAVLPHYRKVLKVIKKCCSVNRAGLDNMINEKECLNPENITLLATASLDILAWLATQPRRIEGYHFRETSRVVYRLDPYVPLKGEDLNLVPYPADDEYNIGDERSAELAALFMQQQSGIYAEF